LGITDHQRELGFETGCIYFTR